MNWKTYQEVSNEKQKIKEIMQRRPYLHPPLQLTHTAIANTRPVRLTPAGKREQNQASTKMRELSCRVENNMTVNYVI